MIEPSYTKGYLVRPAGGPEPVLLDQARVEAEAAALLGVSRDDLTTMPLPRSTLYMSRAAQIERVAPPNLAASKALEKLGLPVSLRGEILVVTHPKE